LGSSKREFPVALKSAPMTEPLVYICWPASPRVLTAESRRRVKKRQKKNSKNSAKVGMPNEQN